MMTIGETKNRTRKRWSSGTQKKESAIMKDRVDSFIKLVPPSSRVMKANVKAMEQGVLHVDAVNSYGNTFGIVFGFETSALYFEDKYWLRYWALKPSAQKFWTVLAGNWNLRKREVCRPALLPRAVLIPALWEDLSFIYNLASAKDHLHWLRQEVGRRVSDSLRFAWIAAAVQ
jgi:hypothetical protein